ncbi:hypothetical protein [Psychromonas hadalis]|uniref:hypothetical protein n=1 Tax=Psychromonas hadalis TaxID=211669 RepID=UPI0003B3A362|nr:hypothetical protein [Psychromonas hadalis]
MLKKILLLSIASLLSACSTLSTDDDLSNAIDSVNNKPTYFEVKGQKLQPNNMSGSNSGVIDATMFITANIAKEGQKAPNSTVKMVLGYFETHNPYKYAAVNGKKVEIKAYKVATSMCTENCIATQYFTFPVSNEDLLNALDSEFIYELYPDAGSKKLKFSVPGEYISALLNGYTANALPASIAPIVAKKITSSPLQMSQDLFVKASDTEKEQFTDWAFKNRKSIEAPLNAEGKILPMLEYWYEKASSDEKAEILTWILAQ